MIEPWLLDNYRGIVAEGRDPAALVEDLQKAGADPELVDFIKSLVPVVPERKSAKNVEKAAEVPIVETR